MARSTTGSRRRFIKLRAPKAPPTNVAAVATNWDYSIYALRTDPIADHPQRRAHPSPRRSPLLHGRPDRCARRHQHDSHASRVVSPLAARSRAKRISSTSCSTTAVCRWCSRDIGGSTCAASAASTSSRSTSPRHVGAATQLPAASRTNALAPGVLSADAHVSRAPSLLAVIRGIAQRLIETRKRKSARACVPGRFFLPNSANDKFPGKISRLPVFQLVTDVAWRGVKRY